jgi:hypothetical protein
MVACHGLRSTQALKLFFLKKANFSLGLPFLVQS